jgi:hypothetical protein
MVHQHSSAMEKASTTMRRALPLHDFTLAKAVVRYGATTLTAVLVETANGKKNL